MRPFTDDDLRVFGESIARSPYQWGRCRHDHPISLSSLAAMPAATAKKKVTGGWYIRLDCPAWSCHKCGHGPIATICRSGVEVAIPDDPARHPWIPYPRQTSAAWWQTAMVLPRTDGVYTATIETQKELFKPRIFRDSCLAFTPEGAVLDFEQIHDGYDKERFQADTAAIVSGFRASESYNTHPDPPRWRGLYAVAGTTLTCSLTEVQAVPYTYVGTLSRDSPQMTLKKLDAKGRKLAKAEYAFRPVSALAVPGPSIATAPIPGPMVSGPPASGPPASGPPVSGPPVPDPRTGTAGDPGPVAEPPAYAVRAAAVHPDRLDQLWGAAKQIGWTNRPNKPDLKSLATALGPAETVHGIANLLLSGGFTQTSAVVVTDAYVFVGTASNLVSGPGWSALAAAMPPEYLVAKDRVRIPLADVEWIDSAKKTLIFSLRGRRITVPVGGDAEAVRDSLVRALTQARESGSAALPND